MAKNYRMEHVVFEIADIDLPFNAIIGRVALYRFMDATHYVYLMMKILAPSGIIVIGVVEKLYSLAATMLAEEGGESPPPKL
jgi:hypothetical protein